MASLLKLLATAK